jgi:hypothetical protein
MASMKTAFICPSGLAVLFVAEAWEFDAFCADRWFFSDRPTSSQLANSTRFPNRSGRDIPPGRESDEPDPTQSRHR